MLNRRCGILLAMAVCAGVWGGDRVVRADATGTSAAVEEKSAGAAAQMTTSAKESVDTLKADVAREKAAEQALRNKTVTLMFERAPLEKVLDAIREQTRCNMTINWETIGTVDLDVHTPVTVQLTDVSYEKALREVLNAASQKLTDPNAKLDFVLDEGVLHISTREDLQSARYQHVRMYKVSDLLEPPNAGSLTRQEKEDARGDRARALAEIIKNTVAADSWRDNQGMIGTIQEYDGVLIVNQTANNHQEIARFLAMLRVAREVKDPLRREAK